MAKSTIRLRPFEVRDLDQHREWINEPEIMNRLGSHQPVSRWQHGEWYKTIQRNRNCMFFSIEVTGEQRYIGNVWLWDIDWVHKKAEIRILIGSEDQRGKGYGSAAICTITYYAFHRLNLHRVFAYIFTSNKASIHAFRKAGFEREGTLRDDRFIRGNYINVIICGRLSDDAG